MVAREIRYYRDLFQEYHGVTQGGPLSPRISKVVVKAILCHWVDLVAENEFLPEGFWYMVEEKASFLYAGDGLVASANLVWIQWDFGVLIVLFEWVGIQTNVANMVAMVCQTGPVSGIQSTSDCGWCMTG